MIYGPNTRAVQAIIDRIPTLTDDECKQLTAAYGAVIDAAWDAARYAAWDAAGYAARDAAWDAAWDATLAAVTYDLATIDGHYTIAQRDLLMTPWIEVCGMPEGLGAALDGEG